MKEIGRVIENRNLISIVEVGGEYCDSCLSKEKCFFHRERERKVEAENRLNAKVGDLVVLEVSPKKYILSTFFIYIFPIISMFVGAFLGEFYLKKIIYKDTNITSIITSFIFLFISIIIVKLIQKFLFFRPTIEEIIKRD